VSQNFGLILDLLVVVMLGATIFYAAVLSRRLSQLRGDRGELQSAVRGLAEAAVKADASVKGMRATADEAGGRLQAQIDRAQGLRDELTFLIDAGESLADRLEQAASGSGGQRRRGGDAADEAPVPANRAERRCAPDVSPESKAVDPKAAPRPELRAEPARRAAVAGKGRGPLDRSLIHAIESLR
jgi:hypothetical protein